MQLGQRLSKVIAEEKILRCSRLVLNPLTVTVDLGMHCTKIKYMC